LHHLTLRASVGQVRLTVTIAHPSGPDTRAEMALEVMAIAEESGPDDVTSQDPSRRILRLWPYLFVVMALFGVAAGTRWESVWGGLFASGLAGLVVLSLFDERFGLLAVLTVAPFEGLLREQLSSAFSWYPNALHVIDPIAVALLLGWFVRWARGRVEVKWRWYDWLAAAFLAVSMIAALRGFLAGYESTLAASRFLPALALYFPARQAVSDSESRRVLLRYLSIYGVAFALIATLGIVLYADTYARRGDVILPRLCRAVDPRILLWLLFLSWAGIWASRNWFKTLALLSAVGLIGGLVAVNNTRTFVIGIVAAWLVICWLLLRARASVRVAGAVAGLGLVFLLAGFLGTHALSIAHPDLGMKLRRQVSQARGITPRRARKQAGAVASTSLSIMGQMRLTAGAARTQQGLENRLREMRAIIDELGTRKLLMGGGLGQTTTFRHVVAGGKERMMSAAFSHNAYLGFLYTMGAPALLMCLVWFLGVVVRGFKSASQVSGGDTPVLWIGSFLFVCAAVLMANAVGLVNAASGAVLFSTAAAVVGSAGHVAHSPGRN